ncbi:hypothetical protein [Natrinema sp. DC36]|nr:hypothetical protein [Natrinema sp. DC36]
MTTKTSADRTTIRPTTESPSMTAIAGTEPPEMGRWKRDER